MIELYAKYITYIYIYICYGRDMFSNSNVAADMLMHMCGSELGQ